MTSTVSVLKACTGGYVGNGHVHPALLDAVREAVAEAKNAGTVQDGYVARCGDDVALILLHGDGSHSPAVRALAVDAFARSGSVGRRLAQHAVSSNGGPHLESVELTFEVRPSEPLVCFLADKAGAGAWNAYLYRAFADPFNTPGLLSDPQMFQGFRFQVTDRVSRAVRTFELPADLHGFLAAAGADGRGVVTAVESASSSMRAAAASDGDDPAMLIRCHAGFPSVGEVLEAFAFPFVVGGWPGGTAAGPLMPVSTNDEAMSRSDGPPRAVGLGFQVSDGRLVGPRDLLGDRAFDAAREQALVAVDYLRRHGPFAPRFPQSVGEAMPLADR